MQSYTGLRKNKLNAFVEIILFIISLIFLYPVYYMIEASVKPAKDFYTPLQLPTSIIWDNYTAVFNKVNVWNGFMNSLLICAGTLAIVVAFCSMGGYVISRLNHRFFKLIFFIFLSGMIIPLQTSMIPLFKLALLFDLMNTRTLMVLIYTAGTIPLATMLYVGYTKNIPIELEDAAFIDGSSRTRMFWRIIFPLLLPATGTLVVISLFGFWNDFITPLIFMQDQNKMTLIMQIYRFKGAHSVEYGPIFALCALATVPLVIIFVFIQKYLIKGITAGAIKG
ncbi:sugar ABC transporter permease [Paenibacillus baekrokdamisoli]|uniref:Sugar ABC transporter permease n=1 Tax=Paenibacillus baekrokdamisoli TaxID=1712516 RepID=A0A3G9J366_9BACL|nr:carbohydrate ABC transporter permease [Paenibacillus baekrokdamisoli]MBB3067661.1 raffinose/stachyose/melibiose transport system permease protein [Paenibacillus baekrokdamisoli]BBH19153.1 sugar ABC transporter permease [Paenibacillus baekrokdamisoli]